MRISKMVAAAGLVAASLGMSVAADAQAPRERVVTTRTVHQTVVTNHHRAGWHRPHCTTVWRHHHRVRTCR